LEKVLLDKNFTDRPDALQVENINLVFKNSITKNFLHNWLAWLHSQEDF